MTDPPPQHHWWGVTEALMLLKTARHRLKLRLCHDFKDSMTRALTIIMNGARHSEFTHMQDTLRLSWNFDAARLRDELRDILPAEYIPHFNTAYYKGDWSVVPLRSIGGSASQIYPDPTAQNSFADTPLLERCPYVRSVLAEFRCPLTAVRFLRLAPGSSIREHKDYNLSLEDGEIRLHIPVATNPDVEFVLGGRRIEMREGECWYLNFNLPHSVANRGQTDRVHLVIDCVVNDWLREMLARDAAAV